MQDTQDKKAQDKKVYSIMGVVFTSDNDEIDYHALHTDHFYEDDMGDISKAFLWGDDKYDALLIVETEETSFREAIEGLYDMLERLKKGWESRKVD